MSVVSYFLDPILVPAEWVEHVAGAKRAELRYEYEERLVDEDGAVGRCFIGVVDEQHPVWLHESQIQDDVSDLKLTLITRLRAPSLEQCDYVELDFYLEPYGDIMPCTTSSRITFPGGDFVLCRYGIVDASKWVWYDITDVGRVVTGGPRAACTTDLSLNAEVVVQCQGAYWKGFADRNGTIRRAVDGTCLEVPRRKVGVLLKPFYYTSDYAQLSEPPEAVSDELDDSALEFVITNYFLDRPFRCNPVESQTSESPEEPVPQPVDNSNHEPPNRKRRQASDLLPVSQSPKRHRALVSPLKRTDTDQEEPVAESLARLAEWLSGYLAKVVV